MISRRSAAASKLSADIGYSRVADRQSAHIGRCWNAGTLVPYLRLGTRRPEASGALKQASSYEMQISDFLAEITVAGALYIVFNTVYTGLNTFPIFYSHICIFLSKTSLIKGFDRPPNGSKIQVTEGL